MSGLPRYLTVTECAALLAVDHKTVRRLIDRGELPALRVGRAIRIASADLEALRYRPEGAESGLPAPSARKRGIRRDGARG